MLRALWLERGSWQAERWAAGGVRYAAPDRCRTGRHDETMVEVHVRLIGVARSGRTGAREIGGWRGTDGPSLVFGPTPTVPEIE